MFSGILGFHEMLTYMLLDFVCVRDTEWGKRRDEERRGKRESKKNQI